MDQGLVPCKCGGQPIMTTVLTSNLVRMYCDLCDNSTAPLPEPDVHKAWQELNAPFLPFVFDVSLGSK